MKFYYHPASSYSQKPLIALYEKGVEFIPKIVNLRDPAERAEYMKTINVFGKIPTLAFDNGDRVPESTMIVEYLEGHYPSCRPRLIPFEIDSARWARFLDRFFDLYINDVVQKIFFDRMKPEAERDPKGVSEAKATLDIAYAKANRMVANLTWANGDDFSIADCSAAPSLWYAQMVYPFEQYKNLSAYAARLAERPSVVRVRSEAAPYLEKLTAR